MPTYCFECSACGNHLHLLLPMRECSKRRVCPICGKFLIRDYKAEQVSVNPDSGDWSQENDGKGRRNPQLDGEVGQQTHFRSKREMLQYLRGQHTDTVGSQGRELKIYS